MKKLQTLILSTALLFIGSVKAEEAYNFVQVPMDIGTEVGVALGNEIIGYSILFCKEMEKKHGVEFKVCLKESTDAAIASLAESLVKLENKSK